MTRLSTAAPDLACRDLDCGIGGRLVLRDISLNIPAGSRTALVGVNGAGKSTLLRALAGITRPMAGIVTLDGRDLNAMPARDRARTVAFVGQEEAPPMELRVEEMVALGRIPHGRPWQLGGPAGVAAVEDALARVGMTEYAQRRCHQLSGGERRRVVLARGLAQEARILALDEPANHLDIAWQLRLLELLDQHDGTVVASMHDLDLVMRHFDQVAVVGAGRLLACGPPEQTLTPALLREAFGVDSGHIHDPVTHLPHLLIRAVSKPGSPAPFEP